MCPDDDLEGMDELAEGTVQRTDAQLADQEAAVLLKTSTNLETFRIKIGNSADFDRLISAVQQSNQNNESQAQLKARLTQLGSGVCEVAKKVAALAAKGII